MEKNFLRTDHLEAVKEGETKSRSALQRTSEASCRESMENLQAWVKTCCKHKYGAKVLSIVRPASLTEKCRNTCFMIFNGNIQSGYVKGIRRNIRYSVAEKPMFSPGFLVQLSIEIT